MRLDIAEVRRDQVLIQYRQVARQAFHEVEDVLVAHRNAGELLCGQEAPPAAAARKLTPVERRYVEGLASYPEALNAQRQPVGAEMTLARTRRSQLVAVVQTYKALGRGWDPAALLLLSLPEADHRARPGP